MLTHKVLEVYVNKNPVVQKTVNCEQIALDIQMRKYLRQVMLEMQIKYKDVEYEAYFRTDNVEVRDKYKLLTTVKRRVCIFQTSNTLVEVITILD